VYGNVGLNTGSSNIRAKFDVIQSSNIPALVVDQYGTGDALQVKDGGVTKLSVNSSGITTISGGVISNSGDGTINRNLLSGIPASNMYLQLYKTGNRTSNTGPSIVFGGSYYPTEDFPTVYAAIKGVATPYVASSADSLGGMLKFYVNDNVVGGSSLEEADCRMVIDQYGNVGIGTTIPQAKLHVNGKIFCPGMPVQTQYYFLRTINSIGDDSITMSTYNPGINISITPLFATSVIKITLNTTMSRVQPTFSLQTELWKNGSALVSSYWGYIVSGGPSVMYTPMNLIHYDTSISTATITYSLRLQGKGLLCHPYSNITFTAEEIAQ